MVGTPGGERQHKVPNIPLKLVVPLRFTWKGFYVILALNTTPLNTTTASLAATIVCGNQDFFFIDPGRCLIVRLYAENSELSYSYCSYSTIYPSPGDLGNAE